MLDYSILNQDEKKFTKDISSFNIKDKINEVIEIQEDKIKFKEINCKL
jgi:hypothetical protein